MQIKTGDLFGLDYSNLGLGQHYCSIHSVPQIPDYLRWAGIRAKPGARADQVWAEPHNRQIGHDHLNCCSTKTRGQEELRDQDARHALAGRQNRPRIKVLSDRGMKVPH